MAWCRGRVGWQRFVSSILSVVSLLTLWGTKQRTNLPKSWHINTLTKLGRSKTIAIFIYYIYLSSLSLSLLYISHSHRSLTPRGGSWRKLTVKDILHMIHNKVCHLRWLLLNDIGPDLFRQHPTQAAATPKLEVIHQRSDGVLFIWSKEF